MYTKAVKYFSAISLNERIKFLRLLLRWQGSVWKLLWGDFLWFIVSYILVTLLYRLYLINDLTNKLRFEAIVKYMNKVAGLVPLSFLLGFFVSTVLGRWWDIVMKLPWLTKSAFTLQALITGGNSTIRRDIRLTIIRYMNLAWILSLVNLSQKVKKRFTVAPTERRSKRYLNKLQIKKPKIITVRQRMEKINSDAMVKRYFGNLIMEEEIKVFENFEKVSKKPTYIIPLVWATKLAEKSYDAGFIKTERFHWQMFKMIQDFRSTLGTLSVYNEFNVPLVYTQVIIIVVYTFLLSEIFTQQLIETETLNPLVSTNATTYVKEALDHYLPVFGIFKFFIYMGWFKVGLSLINPFGEEHGDLPLDVILDYNLEVSASVAPCDDLYLPEYLSESFNGDRFKIFEKFRSILPTQEELIKSDTVAMNTQEESRKLSVPDESGDCESKHL